MAKVSYFSRSVRPQTVFAPSSSGFAPVYEERIGRDGVLGLIKTGEHNINEFVQASLSGTLVYNILDKYQLGDTSVLEKVKGFYADVTSVPKSLIETHNLMKSIESNFDSLPSEIKSKFGNSVETFVSSIENGEFAQIIDSFNKGSLADQSEVIVNVAQKENKEVIE